MELKLSFIILHAWPLELMSFELYENRIFINLRNYIKKKCVSGLKVGQDVVFIEIFKIKLTVLFCLLVKNFQSTIETIVEPRKSEISVNPNRFLKNKIQMKLKNSINKWICLLYTSRCV